MTDKEKEKLLKEIKDDLKGLAEDVEYIKTSIYEATDELNKVLKNE